MSDAETLIARGEPAGALDALKEQVRADAADPKLRVFLFQLLAVVGQWKKAADQLKVCGELDASTLAMVATYAPALACEMSREALFAGQGSPHIFGQPAPWIALLANALSLDAHGHRAQAAAARAQALELAPASGGMLNDLPMQWLADADSRLGPVLEVIIQGRYGWLAMDQVALLQLEPAADLRDLVWLPAQLKLVGGGQTEALVPTRYVGAGEWADGALQMARATEWEAMADGQYRGLGQRVLSSDTQELGLLEVRRIERQVAADSSN